MTTLRATIRGYVVHVYTASALLFLALGAQWILTGNYRLALLAMAATVAIDATDGMLARRYRTKENVPGIQGDLLDNVVDFATYVVLPALFLLRAEMVVQPAALWIGLLLVASAFGFSRTDAKIAGKGFFVGFPSYWNIVVFYLFLLGTTPLLNTVVLLALALLVFVPVRFIYVSRLERGRVLHWSLSAVWATLCLAALLVGPAGPQRPLLYASFAYVAIYLVHSLILDIADRRARESA